MAMVSITSKTPVSSKKQKAAVKAVADNTKENDDVNTPKSKLSLDQVAGGKISEYPIVFTKDSKYFFSCVGSCIKVFSVATGAIVKVLSKSPALGGHSRQITGIMLNPKNPLQLYSCSLDGTIKLWDFSDEVLLKTLHVEHEVHQMVISPSNPDHAFIVVKNDRIIASYHIKFVVFRFDLSSSASAKNRMRQILGLKSCSDLAISKDGQHLAVGGGYQVCVWEINDDEEEVAYSQIRRYNVAEPVTRLAFNPTKSCLAVGDSLGRITLFFCFTPDTAKYPITTILHWHSTAVGALTFMGDGAYLMSGGEEAVLVLWQLETTHKQFLPRMGGAIQSISISPDHKYYCLALGDNSIRLVNSISQQIEQVIQGVQYRALDEASKGPKTGLVVEPRNHHIVMNGVPGNIQAYDTYADRHVMDMQVVPMNQVSRVGNSEIVRPEVEHLAFSSTGEWMATVDIRDDADTTPERYLKFWKLDPNTQSYILHTRVDHPHTDRITSITFNPGSSSHAPMAVTTSLDKSFRVWYLFSNAARTDLQPTWICRSNGVYRNYSPRVAAFSHDGSILAVAFENIITLWDPYQNIIQGVLVPPTNETIHNLHFSADSPYLVSVSDDHLSVWNMLTCSVWWSYRMQVQRISVDPYSTQLAVVCGSHKRGNSYIVVFDSASPVPLLIHTMDDECLGLAWAPKRSADTSSAKTGELIYFNQNHDFVILSVVPRDAKVVSEIHHAVSSVSEAAEADKSVFNDMFGARRQEREDQARKNELIDNQTAARDQSMQAVDEDETEDTTESILDAPSHVLPNLDVTFESFMASLMDLRISKKASEESMEIDTSTPEAIPQQNAPTADNITILESASQSLPTLDAYFAEASQKSQVVNKSSADNTVSLSSDEDSSDDDEEDPEHIEW
ncbi:WD40-repeat-containing domain protein [Radiomyces spectabilis]|uniref:WD40-repeat-containing domain protein n=1 Tax=Radiomyces spectabilis TaxID=64574 RepID=UPI00221FD616|nr:WD40-repeat-containing domain protein [Radiomyces spectabilis]KAI8388924.1 WD40-repeat-containing domain protein [Radiomyces spectabilis]